MDTDNPLILNSESHLYQSAFDPRSEPTRMDLNIQVYVPVYLWVYSTYLTFCNSNCYLKGLYKAVAFASDDGNVKSTGQAMGRKEDRKWQRPRTIWSS